MKSNMSNDELMLHLKRFLLQHVGWTGLNAWNKYINVMMAIENRKVMPDILFIDAPDGSGRDGMIVINKGEENED